MSCSRFLDIPSRQLCYMVCSYLNRRMLSLERKHAPYVCHCSQRLTFADVQQGCLFSARLQKLLGKTSLQVFTVHSPPPTSPPPPLPLSCSSLQWLVAPPPLFEEAPTNEGAPFSHFLVICNLTTLIHSLTHSQSPLKYGLLPPLLEYAQLYTAALQLWTIHLCRLCCALTP